MNGTIIKCFYSFAENAETLSGLHPKIIEITDVNESCGFDYIIMKTVGVGQSEVEIARLADPGSLLCLFPNRAMEICKQ